MTLNADPNRDLNQGPPPESLSVPGLYRVLELTATGYVVTYIRDQEENR